MLNNGEPAVTPDNGGPAFPLDPETNRLREAQGMSLRDYFAGQALMAMLSQPANAQNIAAYDDTNTVARSAYGFADAMLHERAKESQ